MFFYLSKILWFLAEPGNAFLLALLVGLMLRATRWRRLGGGLMSLAIIGALILVFVPLGPWMTRSLEERFPAPERLPAEVDGIVVLGGVISPSLTAHFETVQINGAVERITVSADLAQRYPNAKLIYSGGSPALIDRTYREADYVGEVYAALGIPSSRLTLDREARNTAENAERAWALAEPSADETWLLVTSAFHMPRAMGVFRRIGWEMEPYPVDYQIDPTVAYGAPLSFTTGLSGFYHSFHEWLGLTAYWLTGKTRSAFPKPRPQEEQ